MTTILAFAFFGGLIVGLSAYGIVRLMAPRHMNTAVLLGILAGFAYQIAVLSAFVKQLGIR